MIEGLCGVFAVMAILLFGFEILQRQFPELFISNYGEEEE